MAREAQLDEIEAARDSKWFVGRGDELALFRIAAGVASGSANVLHLYGPGGVGKSFLLRAIGTLARGVGRGVAILDGHEVDSPTSLSAALDGAGLDRADGNASVLLIDNFEHWESNPALLHSDLLNRIAGRSLVVLAGRNAPGTSAWGTPVADVPIRNFSAAVSNEYLNRRGVPVSARLGIVSFSLGQPLALALAAETQLLSQEAVSLPKDCPDVIVALCTHFLAAVTDPKLRQALEICALLRRTKEETLAGLSPGIDAASAFDWLRELSFVEARRDGISLHGRAREALLAEFRQTDPAGLTALYLRAQRYYARRTESPEDILQVRHLLRDNPASQVQLQPAVETEAQLQGQTHVIARPHLPTKTLVMARPPDGVARAMAVPDVPPPSSRGFARDDSPPSSTGTQPAEVVELPTGTLPFRVRWRAMMLVALRMASHDKQRTIGAILGVAFAFLLVAYNVCAIDFYVGQAQTIVANAGADVWMVAPATRYFGGGPYIPAASLYQARTCPGVDWAEPLVMGSTSVRLPDGSARSVTLVGARAPSFRGGPYNIVAGKIDALLEPNTLFFDDVGRETLGGLNLDSVIEVSQHRVRVGGFTWGILFNGDTFAFAELDFARLLLGADSDRISYVLIGLAPGANRAQVLDELRHRVPEVEVVTSETFLKTTENFILNEGGLGALLIMGIFIGLVVGFGLVGLSMVSSVQQYIREFGTMKAIGATNADLRRLLMVQALTYAFVGSLIGVTFTCALGAVSRSGSLNLIVKPRMLFELVPFVTAISIICAVVALRRVYKLEPASVFR